MNATSKFSIRAKNGGVNPKTPSIPTRVAALDWDAMAADLDKYGVTALKSVPGKDFTGGEFVLTEQRPRMQSRAEVVSLQEGDGVAFAVTHRPVQGSKGTYRVNLRHGVSRLRSGHRNTMGIIFHDGK